MQPSLQQLATLLAAQTPPGGCGGDALTQMGPILLMLPIFWFLVISPARREKKQQDDMLAALKRGDEVLTQGGLLGTITDFEGQLVVLEIAKNTKVKLLRSAILKRYAPEVAKASKDEEAKA